MTKRQWIGVLLTEAVGLFVTLFAGFVGMILAAPDGFFGSRNSAGDRVAGVGWLALAALGAVAGWLVAARLRRSTGMAVAATITAAVLWGLGLAFALA